jgi:hypothetical protein
VQVLVRARARARVRVRARVLGRCGCGCRNINTKSTQTASSSKITASILHLLRLQTHRVSTIISIIPSSPRRRKRICRCSRGTIAININTNKGSRNSPT